MRNGIYLRIRLHWIDSTVRRYLALAKSLTIALPCKLPEVSRVYTGSEQARKS
jgi:hypothetical protein